MKKVIFKGAQKIWDDKSYIPDETLVTFIQDWLHIHKKREKLAKEGIDLRREEKLRIRELDRRKVYILDNIIFPAFANLTYFLEATASSSLLSSAFSDDLEELLDTRYAREATQFHNTGRRFGSMQFGRNNLARLVSAALTIQLKNYPARKTVTDFRLALMYQILNIVGDSMDLLLEHEYSYTQIWNSFWDDYKRMLGWIALLARSAETSTSYTRMLGFEPIWLSNKAGIKELEF